MIKAYLFDFDGTLVDSMPAYISVMTGVLDDFGIEYGDDLIKTITPLGTAGTIKYYIEELGVKCTPEELAEKLAAARAAATEKVLAANAKIEEKFNK